MPKFHDHLVLDDAPVPGSPDAGTKIVYATAEGVFAKNSAGTVFPLGELVAANQLELDYLGRTDKQPVYLGKAPPSALDTEAKWQIIKFTYASGTDDARLLFTNAVENAAWSDRLTLLP
jgi:hypothetical protein